MTRLTLALIILFLLIPSPARAEWPYDQFNCRAYRADLYWKQWARRHCPGWRWRHRRYRHVHRAPRPDADVMRYQLLLRERGYDLEADGLMGPDTRNALRRFQRRHDLDPTGTLGPLTKAALRRSEARTDGNEEEDPPNWSRRPEICREDDGRECTCDPITAFSGEHVGKDAGEEARKRWRGEVRSRLGELWLGMEDTAKPDCWLTGTGERNATDRLGHRRCVIEVKACFGPTPPRDEPQRRSDRYVDENEK